MKLSILSLFSVLLIKTVSAVPHSRCPPDNLFRNIESFDLKAYLGTWYVFSQMPTRYLPETSNYCVKADYSLNKDGKSISIFNYANKGKVNGRVQSVHLNGMLNSETPYKLKVGPGFIPSWFYGPYWVIATSPILENEYQWAVISGGSPDTLTSNNRCIAQSNSFIGNHQGLWVFARNPDAFFLENVYPFILETITNLGIDIRVLKFVQQDGCTFKQ